jgi:hypothetical protein
MAGGMRDASKRQEERVKSGWKSFCEDLLVWQRKRRWGSGLPMAGRGSEGEGVGVVFHLWSGMVENVLECSVRECSVGARQARAARSSLAAASLGLSHFQTEATQFTCTPLAKILP